MFTWNQSFRLTIDKLEVAKRICPKIKKMDISMFNFSFDDQDEATAAELSKSSAMYFEFEVIVNLFGKNMCQLCTAGVERS